MSGEHIIAGLVIDQRTRALLVFSSLAINTTMLAMPLATLQIYDRVLTHPDTGTLPMLAVGVILAVLIECGLRLARTRLTNALAHAYEQQASARLVSQVVASWAPRSHGGKYGEYLQALGALGRIRDYALQRLIVLSVDVPYLLLFLVALWLVGGILVLVPLLAVACFMAVVLRVGVALRTAIAARNQHDQQRYGFMLEALSGVHAIKAMGLEPRFMMHYQQYQQRVGGDGFRIALFNHALSSSGAMFSQVMVVLVVACGTPLVLSGALSMGGLIACVLLSGRLIQPLQHALSCWISHQEFQQARAQTAVIEALPLQPQFCPTAAGTREGRVELQEVSFRYADESPRVLHGLNLTLQPGEALAITGESNAGRSTLLKLVAGLYAPDHGRVLLDGLEPSQLLPSTLAKYVGYLDADAVLMRGTILQNLCGFEPEMEARAHELARLVGLDGLVARLPGGYETELDGNGAEVIPPGMRQRIAIARGLRHKPRLILFDQADRSLDREGYHQLFSLLARLKGRASMLIVTDDQNLMRLCDRRLHLHGGRLIPTADGRSPALSLIRTEDAA